MCKLKICSLNKAYFVVLLLIIPFCNLLGQSKMKIGVNTGAIYSSLRGSDILERTTSKKVLLLAGVSFEWYLKDNLSFKTNLNFDQKSIYNQRSYTISIFDNNTGMIKNENYLEKKKRDYYYLIVPLLLKYNFGKNKDIFVNGGLYYAHIIKTKMENDVERSSSDSSNNSVSEKENNILSRGFSLNDLGISFGAGKTFILESKNELTIEIRDNLGFSNTIYDSHNDFGKIKTNSLNLIFNYSFGL
jgi:hypothetical protein